MRKRVLVVLLVAAMVMFSFSFSALAEFKIESNIKILPMGASGDYPVVVKDDFGNIVEGILVAGMFHEHFQNKDDILFNLERAYNKRNFEQFEMLLDSNFV